LPAHTQAGNRKPFPNTHRPNGTSASEPPITASSTARKSASRALSIHFHAQSNNSRPRRNSPCFASHFTQVNKYPPCLKQARHPRYSSPPHPISILIPYRRAPFSSHSLIHLFREEQVVNWFTLLNIFADNRQNFLFITHAPHRIIDRANYA
jgi:hypothetical protein